MSVSLEYLERCAAETGYQIGALEKVVRLGEMASDIARHQLLGGALALKGGTALNLCFGQPTRLSVDLDFNYVASADREQMLADRSRVEAALEDLARRRAYRVQCSADAFAGRKIFLTYNSVLGRTDRIEVDLNFLFRVPLAGIEMRDLWQPGDLDRPSARVVSLVELCAGKILALLDRSAPRDVWDVGRFPDAAGTVVSSQEFRRLFIALSVTLDHPLETYGRDRLERVTEKDLREQLLPVLATAELPDPRELIEKAWAVVAPLLDLDPAERGYIEALYRGELHAELLFPEDPEVARRIASHPAIGWKLANVRKHGRTVKSRKTRRSRPKRASDK